jgi:hypothetical protein
MIRLNLFRIVPAMLVYSIALADPPAVPAQPGTLNAINGEISINGIPVNSIIGEARAAPEARQIIRTGQGMAEILLNPGSFLRLGKASELTLETEGTPEIRATLLKGEALVEILDADAALTMEQNGVTALLQTPGLYEFNEKRSIIAVYAGQARLNKADKQLTASAGFGVRRRRFLVFPTHPDPGNALFLWSRSRSQQLSSESRVSAQENNGATRSIGPQWHWDPWSGSYTFLSASGFVTGPFGWPYFSPGYAPDSISERHGDSWLYGPPVLSDPGLGKSSPVHPLEPERGNVMPTVPLTAPGEPHFPNNR